jgi:3',5'-cyclic AMP phosphodiesterase CpdA
LIDPPATEKEQAMRIVQISDTHISHLGGVTTENFTRLVEFVNDDLRPDLIVNSGDVSILTPDSEADRESAYKLHRAFHAPVHVLPGNHDLGEAGDHAWMGISVTSERVANFLTTFGSDRFVKLIDDNWAIVGINSEILSSGLPEEAEQWGWLNDVGAIVSGRSVLLFLHKPLWSPLPEFTAHALAIETSDRDRILALFSSATLKAVGSGHLHRYRSAFEGSVLTVWAPSSAFIVKGRPKEDGPLGFSQLGLNQLGVVEYRIEDNEIEAYFRSVPTLREEEPWEMVEFTETMAAIEAAASA